MSAALLQLLVLLAGAGWVMRRREQLGSVVRLAVGGLALQIVALLGSSAVLLYQLRLMDNRGEGYGWLDFYEWSTRIGTAVEVVSLAGVAMLAVAVFADRPSPMAVAGGQ